MREIGTRERGRKWPEQKDIDKEREEGRGESETIQMRIDPVAKYTWRHYKKQALFTDLTILRPAYSDTLGKSQKCRYKQSVTLTDDF